MLLDYTRIDPELLPALEALPALDLNRENIAQYARPHRLTPSGLLLPSRCYRTEKAIDTADGTVDVYIYRKNEQPAQPAVLWIHGGGYIMGDAEDERARIIADHCNCTVFSVDYRLAPEHPFPAGPNDCYAALGMDNE